MGGTFPNYHTSTPHFRVIEEAVSRISGRILVADDNADMRDYVVNLLSRNWEIVWAVDGQHALELIQTQMVDLILSDVMVRCHSISIKHCFSRCPHLHLYQIALTVIPTTLIHPDAESRRISVSISDSRQ